MVCEANPTIGRLYHPAGPTLNRTEVTAEEGTSPRLGAASLGLAGLVGSSRLVHAEVPVFEWGVIKTGDDSLAVLVGGGLDEGVAFRFLGLEIADHFDFVKSDVLLLEPALDVFGSDPRGQVPHEDCSACGRAFLIHRPPPDYSSFG